MRETNVIIFLDYSYEDTGIPSCEGKVSGTNVAQGAVVASGDRIQIIVSSTGDK